MRQFGLILFRLSFALGLTLAAQTPRVPPSNQAPPATSKMTNADVIQLVTAGLSEQVILTAIRQASPKDFDVTPGGLVALKKGGVSDALILAMQEGDTPTEPASRGDSPATGPVPATSNPETANPMSFEVLSEAVTLGREVSFPIKYDSTGLNSSRYTAMYACCGNAAVYMADGVVTLSRTKFAFRGTVGGSSFNVSPDKILELANQPAQSSRIHVKVAIKNKKGDKENKKDFYFYNAGATGVGDGTVGGPGASIICSGCDDSMDVLYGLLTKIRSSDYATPAGEPAATSAASGPAAAGDVATGSYECWASGSARTLPNFTIRSGGQYIGSDGRSGSYALDAGGRITFKGGMLDGVLPAGFYIIYYAPQGRPTVSFRNSGGSEVAFCQDVKHAAPDAAMQTAPAAREAAPTAPQNPETPPVTVSLGQTIDQVVAALGPPEKIIDLGAKKTYLYKELKVVFLDGKVSDVQ
jgi:hypothetical protein